ncbi:MAG: 2-hydroxyacid dehydrogenase, partial [Pseudomonadota bacterium]
MTAPPEKPDVILTTDFWHPEAVRRLGEAYTVHDAVTPAKLEAVLAGHAEKIRAVATDGINGIPNAVLEKLPAVEIVGNNGVGYDKVDVGYCAGRDIKVCNTPGVLNEGVAELTLALMLAH